MNEYHCSLKCWTCGDTVNIATDGPPRFAFEIANWANQIGWIGDIDLNQGRSLVFCSESCRCKAVTKNGTYKARPPKRMKNEAAE